jgi:membrane-associated phospholipid phosphatase
MTGESDGFLRGSRWLIFGPPAVSLILLLCVEWMGLNQPVFFFFNDLSSWTGPAIWAHLTILGDGLVCAVLILPWVRSRPERVWGGILGALVMVLVLRSFKSFLPLPRPLGLLPTDMVNVIGPGLRRGAFPSGHTSTMALLAGILALTSVRRSVPWLALCMAVLVGMSRMAVGVHWPSDVLAGLALGWTSAWVGLRLASRSPWGMEGRVRAFLTAALLISALVLLTVYDTGYPGVGLFQRGLALVCLAWGIVELRNPWKKPVE